MSHGLNHSKTSTVWFGQPNATLKIQTNSFMQVTVKNIKLLHSDLYIMKICLQHNMQTSNLVRKRRIEFSSLKISLVDWKVKKYFSSTSVQQLKYISTSFLDELHIDLEVNSGKKTPYFKLSKSYFPELITTGSRIYLYVCAIT